MLPRWPLATTRLLLFVGVVFFLLSGAVEGQTPVPPNADLRALFASGGSFSFSSGTWSIDASIEVSGSLSLRGAGSRNTVLDCGGRFVRAFYLDVGASLSLFNLSVVNCASDDKQTVDPYGGGGGGAIIALGSTIVLESVSFANHTSVLVNSTGLATATGGGAILLLGGSQLTATSSQFTRNYGTNGGAVYATDSARVTLTNTNFQTNRVADGKLGGALLLTGATDSTINGCRFVSNSAPGGNGGAAYTAGNSKTRFEGNYWTDNRGTYGACHYGNDDADIRFINDQFIGNPAANAGGASEIGGSAIVKWKYCLFDNNTASGAQSLSLRGGHPTIDSCIFRGDRVYRQSEALINALSETTIMLNTTVEGSFSTRGAITLGGRITSATLEDCTFKNNIAFNAGALNMDGYSIDTVAPTDIVIKNTVFKDNRALTAGGAIGGTAPTTVFRVRFVDCEFDSNIAGSSGGVGLFENGGLYEFKDCKFTNNEAPKGGVFWATDGAVVADDSSEYSKNKGTYGGVLYQNGASHYRFSDSRLKDNRVVLYGGVLFVDQRATACSRFENARFEDNTADQSGGAIYFDSPNVPCNGLGALCRPCSFKNNEARFGYGNDYASAPRTLARVGDKMDKLYPTQTFVMNFEVKDYFNQTLQGFVDMAVRLLPEGNLRNDSKIGGTLTRQPTREGKVIFDDVLFGVLPGEDFRISFETNPPTSRVSMRISVEDCDSEQVTYQKNGYYYCLDREEPDDIAKWIVIAAASVIIALAILVLLMLVWKRKKKPIHNATPLMCYLIVVGVILCAVSVTMWTKADDAMCALRGWFLGVGLTLVFGAIFVRAYRLLWIFSRTKDLATTGRKRVITNVDLAIGLGVLLAVTIIVLVIWMGVGGPWRTVEIDIDVSGPKADNTITYECDYSSPSSVFIIILIVIECLLLAFNCVVAFATRNIPSSFNESKYVAFTMYNAAIMMIVAIVLVIVFSDDKTAILIIVALTVLFQCLVTLVVLFAPKLYLSFLNREQLIKMMSEETTALYQEVWSRERQVHDIQSKTGGTTNSASIPDRPLSTGSDFTPQGFRSSAKSTTSPSSNSSSSAS